jgi:hypothetical protein
VTSIFLALSKLGLEPGTGSIQATPAPKRGLSYPIDLVPLTCPGPTETTIVDFILLLSTHFLSSPMGILWVTLVTL